MAAGRASKATPAADGASAPASVPTAAPGRSRLQVAALLGAVSAAAIVALLALNATGVWPNFGHSEPSSGPASFGTWRALAQDSANGYRSGSWTLVRADALLFSTPWGIGTTEFLDLAFLGHQCTPAPAPGIASSIPIPAIANLSQGLSHAWLYWFSNQSGTGAIVVLVLDGAASVLGSASGAACILPGSSNAVGPGVIDSTTAAPAIGSAGAYAYLAQHHSAYGVLEVQGNLSWPGKASGPAWTFEAVDCTPVYGGGSSTAGFGFQTTLDPLTGTESFTESGLMACVIPP
jgi:hypothetical protein